MCVFGEELKSDYFHYINLHSDIYIYIYIYKNVELDYLPPKRKSILKYNYKIALLIYYCIFLAV